MRKRVFANSIGATLAAIALGLPCAWGAGTFVPGDQPFGDVPPLSLTGFNLSTGTQRAFQVYFSNLSFSGDVSAYPVGVDGRTQLANKLWSATENFDNFQACGGAGAPYDAPSSSLNYWDVDRHVVTRDGATPILFRWGAGGLSNAQKLTIDPDTADGGNGDLIHRFIRGDRSNEVYQQVADDAGTIVSACGVLGGALRARVSILGDALHGRPVYVGAPPADFTFDNYAAFKAANASRATRLYVGANDGMVHAFDANSGNEQFAYIPSMLIPNLSKLSVNPYAHTYFVDGQMAAGDVNFGTTAAPDWRTVIVGGLGAGGKGIFALDVTDPSVADENQAKTKLLWEITPASSGFADLGYTYGNPVIARMNTGEWAAIVNNGYVNTNTGHAVLYVINIRTGVLIHAFDTGSGTIASPNGMSSATAVDTSFDGKVDRIYAGDIDGNLWKFDVSNASAASWPAPTKLFPVAVDIANGITAQAIVGAPDVAAHPISGFLVYFATGRMFTLGDAVGAAAAAVQNYAYAVWDGAPVANETFLNQTLTEKLYVTQRVRVSSGLPINWNNPADPVLNPMRKGWRTALPPGERVIGSGFVRDARYQFTAVNPTIAKTPPPNGENWLIELEYLSGGAADKPVFDLNGDSVLNDADRVPNAAATGPQTGATGIPVAVYMGAGLLSQPLLASVSAQLSTTLFNDNPTISPGEVPLVPPPATERGVAGGHFDIEIWYKSAGAYICTYAATGAAARVTLNFTYGSTSKNANTLSIKLRSPSGVLVEAMSSQSPGSKTASNLASFVGSSGNQTNAIKNDWTITRSGSTVTFTAKVNGVAWNGYTLVVSTGAGMTASDYTGENTVTASGVDNTRGDISSCSRKVHVHRYDKTYNVTGVNFLNASDATLNLSKAIPGTTTPFKIIVSNQYLSPAVTLTLGGAPHVSIKNFTTGATPDVTTLPSFTRANIGTFAYDMPIDAFSIKDWWTGAPPAVCSSNTAARDCRAGLHPTNATCVISDSANQGASLVKPVIPPAKGVLGRGTTNWVTTAPYTGSTGVGHNGALTWQIISDTTPNSALELAVPGEPEYGWRVKEAFFEDYVLAMYTTFWHYVWRDTTGANLPIPPAPANSDACYQDAAWTKQPVPDLSPDKEVLKTPAVGSADPGSGTSRPSVTVLSAATTTTTSGGNTITVTTTNYSDGSQMIVTTTTDSSGNATTTAQYVPPPAPPPNPNTGSGIGQAVSSPNTITGYQQTRNSGKLGRVTWHELLRQ